MPKKFSLKFRFLMLNVGVLFLAMGFNISIDDFSNVKQLSWLVLTFLGIYFKLSFIIAILLIAYMLVSEMLTPKMDRILFDWDPYLHFKNWDTESMETIGSLSERGVFMKKWFNLCCYIALIGLVLGGALPMLTGILVIEGYLTGPI